MSSPLHTADTIDNAVIYMQRHDILTVPPLEVPCGHMYGDRPVKVGPFVFDCHVHSTGNGLTAYVIAGGKSLKIIATTFWLSSGYTHNDSLWRTDGAWALALNEALDTLRLTAAGHALGVIKQTADFLVKKMAEADAEREFFGRQFVGAQP